MKNYNTVQICFLDSVCQDIKIVTADYGNENSWTFGACSSKEVYGDNQIYFQECCQQAARITLTCKCSYGDGWHGGYIEVGGKQYCGRFNRGYSQSHKVLMLGKSVKLTNYFPLHLSSLKGRTTHT